jgi:hypothetical protein
VFKRNRLPLTGNRWGKRWVICRRTKPTFSVFPVLSVAVMDIVILSHSFKRSDRI